MLPGQLLMELVLEPPEILKEADGSFWAWNSLTKEKVKIADGGDWKVLQDAPTEPAYLVDASCEDTKSLWAPDLFKYKLYRHAVCYFVHDQTKQIFTRLEDYKNHHRPLDVSVVVSGATTGSKHSVWFFKHADGGCHFSWSLFNVASATVTPFMKGKKIMWFQLRQFLLMGRDMGKWASGGVDKWASGQVGKWRNGVSHLQSPSIIAISHSSKNVVQCNQLKHGRHFFDAAPCSKYPNCHAMKSANPQTDEK